MIQKIIYRGLLAAMALLAVSCTKEQIEPLPQTGALELSIDLPTAKTSTRATASEDYIKSIAVLVFDASSSTLEARLYIDNTANMPADQIKWSSGILIVKNLPKTTLLKDIYVVANYDVSGITTVEGLEAIKTSVALPSSPFVMYGAADNVNTEFVVRANLERLAVKVDVSISLNDFLVNMPNSVVNGVEVTMVNAIGSSVLVPNGTSTDDFADTPLSVGNTTGNIWRGSGYIYENYNTSRPTYLRIKLICKAEEWNTTNSVYELVDKIFYYKANIGKVDEDYVLRRNHCYTIAYSILGKGYDGSWSDPVPFSLLTRSAAESGIRLDSMSVTPL